MPALETIAAHLVSSRDMFCEDCGLESANSVA